MFRVVLAGLLLVSAVALADVYEQRDKLEGSWQIQTDNGKEPSTVIFSWFADGVKMTGSTSGKTLIEFQCKMAQDCDVKDAGKRAKVTLYFNGPKLVETETIGSRVVRRRYEVTGDGNTMELEIIPIEPEGKAETVTFKRLQTQAAAKQ